MKIIRTIRTKSERLGVEITIQSLTGETHSAFPEQEEQVGKMLDGIRKSVSEALEQIERLNDGR